jgi:hypothetical protein
MLPTMSAADVPTGAERRASAGVKSWVPGTQKAWDSRPGVSGGHATDLHVRLRASRFTYDSSDILLARIVDSLRSEPHWSHAEAPEGAVVGSWPT